MKITTLSTTILAAILGVAFAGAPLALNAQTTDPTTTTTSGKPEKKKKKDKAPAKTDYKGSVTAIDTKATPNTMTVDSSKKKDGSKTVVLTLASTTVYKKGGKDGTDAAETDVTVGATVTGSFTKDASGTMTASSVYIK